MEKIKYPRVEEILYREVLHNGLEVYLIPNKNVKNFYMTFPQNSVLFIQNLKIV